MSMQKRYVFVMRHPPHAGWRLQETLDQLLTTAAFDQSVTVLWLDQGVYQLSKHQQPACMGLPDTAAALTALPLYGVEQLFVEQESLAASGLALDDLVLPLRCLPRSQVNALLQQHAIIMGD
jgi:tRNA 2-thiouridine synthesizing protein C